MRLEIVLCRNILCSLSSLCVAGLCLVLRMRQVSQRQTAILPPPSLLPHELACPELGRGGIEHALVQSSVQQALPHGWNMHVKGHRAAIVWWFIAENGSERSRGAHTRHQLVHAALYLEEGETGQRKPVRIGRHHRKNITMLNDGAKAVLAAPEVGKSRPAVGTGRSPIAARNKTSGFVNVVQPKYLEVDAPAWVPHIRHRAYSELEAVPFCVGVRTHRQDIRFLAALH